MKTKNKKSPQMTQISISLPENLVRLIDQMAAAENRNRSNYVANTLARLAKEFAEQEACNER